jgi:hypothetical protein
MGRLIDKDGFCWVPITVHEHDQQGKKIFFVAVRHCRGRENGFTDHRSFTDREAKYRIPDSGSLT